MSVPQDEPSARFAKAERFLRAAEFLAASRHFDATPGRSYYAAYHAIVALLISMQVMPAPTGRWSHGHVQGRFRALTGDNFATRRLRRLYQDRLVADYSTDEVSEERAAATVVTARSIIADAKRRS
jgi:uncharacterized protein (UPF0332 family)